MAAGRVLNLANRMKTKGRGNLWWRASGQGAEILVSDERHRAGVIGSKRFRT
jgi:hypothetical protein